MSKRRPFNSPDELFTASREESQRLVEKDWLEAFAAHPKIGDSRSISKHHNNTTSWAEKEQSGVQAALPGIVEDLAEANEKYQAKFGYIFIVCATGKSAMEMLTLLRQRIDNSHTKELAIAAAEQAKITRLRLEKLLV